MGKLFGTDGIRGVVGENLTAEATVEEIVHRGVLPLYR